MSGQSILLNGVSKSWDGVAAVSDVNLDVAPGTFTVLLGPSGCGKSTSLRIIAGLESADTGVVVIGGEDVTHAPPPKRNIAMVFQSYALFPHLNVAENILFGLKVRRTGKTEQRQRLQRTAEMLGLSPFLDRKPSQLSGGQQQRVALGRAIISEKPICLMDEPLSNLDAKLRHTMRTEIRELQQSLGFTMVYVTHDQSEAITMADQVVLMRGGKVEQAGTPRDIYQRPATAFAAGFIGTPPMNVLPAADLLKQLDTADTQPWSALLVAAQSVGALVGIRPEHLRLADSVGLTSRIRSAEYLGSDVLIDCDVGDSLLLARIDGSLMLRAGDAVKLTWDNGDMHFFGEATGRRTEILPAT